MVTIKPYQESYFEALSSYELDERQATFALVPKYILTNPAVLENTLRVQYCVLYNDEPVGFFSLDRSDDRLIYTDNQQSILLRALSIMPQHQGKGIAKSMLLLLPEYVKASYPTINEIVFGVNFENEDAYNLYLKTGYTDANRVYQGPKGPQHSMFKKIF